MKNKLILAFGVLGVIAMFIPTEGMTLFSLFKLLGMSYLVPIAGGFAAAAVMGIMSMKGPMLKWQSGVAVAGFAAASIRLEVWKVFPHIGELFKMIPMLLIVVAAIAGLIVSVLALLKSE